MTKRPLKLSLSKPIMFAGREMPELELREPMAGDIRKMPAGGNITVGDFLEIIAALSSLPPDLVDELSPADALAAIELLTPFFVRSPSTGPTS